MLDVHLCYEHPEPSSPLRVWLAFSTFLRLQKISFNFLSIHSVGAKG